VSIAAPMTTPTSSQVSAARNITELNGSISALPCRPAWPA
jgi:hypothetical protein